MKAIGIISNTKKYYTTAIRELEVDFDIVRNIEDVRYNVKFDYLAF